MTSPKTLRCAVYTRKSTEEGLEQAFNSLDAQREACAAYVLSQAGEGWIALPTLYDDGGFSGGNLERPALKALLADIDRGLIDVVVVYKVDRLTRALADFAQIVERFDNRKVSFVSVTQAFNTTSSMGRLTLNVLLSFAQFEREVTSERIRDKLAASRRKGMWMGGRPPFGYSVTDKKIFPHESEARIVREIFSRYLELRSVRALRNQLKAEGVVSRSWVSRHGHANGGTSLDRGALYHILQNRIYVGEIRHKDERHPGQHVGIVDLPLFEAVQSQLAASRRRELGAPHSAIKHPLAGLIWDGDGNRMSPTHGQKNGKRYRYYVSRPLIDRQSTIKTGLRLPAIPIEELVRDRIDRILAVSSNAEGGGDDTNNPDPLRTIIERVTISRDSITLALRRDPLEIALRHARSSGLDGEGKTIEELKRRLDPADHLFEHNTRLDLVITVRSVRRGNANVIELSSGESGLRKPRHDPVLLKAIARAHIWLELMLCGQADTLRAVAAIEGTQERYVRRLIPLAFLAPGDLRRTLDGRAPRNRTVDGVARDGLPMSWHPDPGD